DVYKRQNLYRNIVMHYLLKVKDSPENSSQFMNTFVSYSPNNSHMREITKLHNDIKSLQPNNNLPSIRLLNINGKAIRLNEIALDKQAVFYFWSGSYQKHLSRTLTQISLLEKQFPSYTFIGINRNTEYNAWLKIVQEKGLSPENQFRSENFDELKTTLVIDHLNKSIVTNKGLITNGFADLYSLRLK
ncbi:MAG: transaldolase, partial [Flavobacteriia bacterium]|nr:transaldolase [Flavobacteriia bacterium]